MLSYALLCDDNTAANAIASVMLCSADAAANANANVDAAHTMQCFYAISAMADAAHASAML